MGDCATAEKNIKQTPQETESTLEKKSMLKIISEEKLERVHEVAESILSVQPTKIENDRENPKEGTVKSEENPARIEEKSVSKEEKPVPKEENQEKKDDGTEKTFANEEIRKLERQNKTEPIEEQQIISNSVVIGGKQPREKIIRNQSDIFSLKDISTTLQTSIFSVNGCPSRKLFRKQEPAGHLFQKSDDPPADKVSTPMSNRITKENYNDEKRPSSSYRNPLTGSGLSSNDEYKSKGTKRKDGNPLLGLGYDTEVVSSVTSQRRIPPGGFSHKLW